MVTLKIEKDDLTRPEIHALLEEHLQSMYELSPPESVDALDLEAAQARNHLLVRLGRFGTGWRRGSERTRQQAWRGQIHAYAGCASSARRWSRPSGSHHFRSQEPGL